MQIESTTPIAIALVALAPLVLAFLRNRPVALVAAAAGAAVIPFALPESHTILRFGLLILVWCMAIKVAQYLASDECPASFLDFVQFLTVLAVADWDAPRVPDRGGAVRSIATGALQLALFGAIVLVMRRIPGRSVVMDAIAIGVLLYLALAGATNLLVSLLRFRGIPHIAPFASPLLARSPAEFWGRRWNTWVSHVLHRFAFLPAGGRRHPIRGTFAAFGASAVLHEALVAGATLHPSGWMLAFFGVQAAAAIASSRSKSYRALVRSTPAAATFLTLSFMLATGWMFVNAMARVLEGAP